MPSFGSRGFELYYEVHGEGRVPVLWLVGIGATGQGWLALQVPEFAKSRANVVCDPRGAGRSGDPGGAFTTADLAGDAVALLDELGIERAHVVGVFLGGLVAQELAIASPERVHGLCLVGSCAHADAKRRLLLESWKGLAERSMSRELWTQVRLCWTLHDDTLEQTELIDALTRFHLETEPPFDDKVLLRQIDACLQHDTLPRLGQIQAPTLVVTGESDILTPPTLARELARGIPNSELVLMANAAHLVMAEAAARFNRLVGRFLEQAEGLPG